MATTINDVALADLARILSNHGRPFEIRRAREAADRAAERNLSNQLLLQEQESRNTGQNQLNALTARQKFEAEQGDLDRKNRLAVSEAQGKAMVDRAAEAQLGKLRAKYPQHQGESLEAWNARIQQEQARPINDVFRVMNELRGKLEGLEASESTRRARTARLLAERSKEVDDAVMGFADEKILKLHASSKSLSDFVRSLRENKREQAADVVMGAVTAAETRLLEGADERGRPFIPISPDYQIQQRAIQDEISALRSQADIQLRDPDFIGHSHLKFGRGAEALNRLPAGIDTARELLKVLMPGVTRQEPPTSQTESSEVQTAPTDANPLAARVPASADDPMRVKGLFPWLAETKAAKGVADVATKAVTGTAKTIANAGIGIKNSGNLLFGGQLTEPYFAPEAESVSSPALPLPPLVVEQKIVRLFGPDAPSLLIEAGEMAERNGISKADQKATFDAAMGGDTTAQQKISTVLRFLRSGKHLPPMPDYEVPQYPGLDNLQIEPRYSGPELVPGR